MIRKYEMEAMASQVMVGLKERIQKLESDTRKTSQYKAIEKKHKHLLALHNKHCAIDKEARKLRDEINDDILALNDNPNTSKNCRLQSLSWNHTPLTFKCDTWQIKREIEEKLTVALIKPDAKKYIEKIVAQVVDAIKL